MKFRRLECWRLEIEVEKDPAVSTSLDVGRMETIRFVKYIEEGSGVQN